MKSQSHDYKFFLGLDKVPLVRLLFGTSTACEFIRQLQERQQTGGLIFSYAQDSSSFSVMTQLSDEGTQKKG